MKNLFNRSLSFFLVMLMFASLETDVPGASVVLPVCLFALLQAVIESSITADNAAAPAFEGYLYVSFLIMFFPFIPVLSG